MGVFFYNIFLLLFRLGSRLASLFSPKAAKWVQGRQNIFDKLESSIKPGAPIIWMHCASLGEFEQGRPVLEKLRQNYPGYRILLTFFSPSGYEVRKDYDGADWVFYLPLDGAKRSRRFLEIVQPSLVIFVKYEFWYYYLKKIKYREIPLLLVSALFRENMSFFRWYGAIQRKILSRFDQLFVQNTSSKELISRIGLGDICTVSGDTRFDRVVEIAEKSQPLAFAESFRNNRKLIVAGSTWKNDEELLARYINETPNKDHCYIIAPHEISAGRIAELKQLFPGCALFSEWNQGSAESKQVLIIDNVGMLSKLYRHADLCFVGGGFGSGGIHNILEAAVFGKPVVFGPVYQRYYEAVQLIEKGGAISVANYQEFEKAFNALLGDTATSAGMGNISREYVYANRGATEIIMRFIQEKRLLTR